MNSSNEKKTIINYFDQAALATEFQRVFLKLENLSPAKEAKSLLITSSIMGEGKSTIASFLAISISQFGDRSTVLLDADLRKPAISKLFDVDSSPGLTDLLQGRANLQKIIKPTILGNLKIITGGLPTPNVDKILGLQSLKDLFTQLKSSFEFTIIDSAPVMMLPDTLNLSQTVDGVILVVKAGVTPKEVVKRACEALQDSGVNLLGVILNNVKGALPDYYSYKYYSYKYKYEKRKNLKL
jgi:capsular exopolysaccharide synthesis family protein